MPLVVFMFHVFSCFCAVLMLLLWENKDQSWKIMSVQVDSRYTDYVAGMLWTSDACFSFRVTIRIHTFCNISLFGATFQTGCCKVFLTEKYFCNYLPKLVLITLMFCSSVHFSDRLGFNHLFDAIKNDVKCHDWRLSSADSVSAKSWLQWTELKQ